MTSTVVAGIDSHTRTSARQEWLYAGLVLLCGLVVLSPLLQPGYFWGAHDARHDVYFIQQYGLSFKEGILWPRWSPDWAFGYGYPFFTIYAPLSTFVGVLFNQLLGLGYEASVKAVLILSVLGSGLAMHGFVRSWLGRHAGLVAAVAYMAVPYHLVNLFVRAALAESVALAFLPLALWGFREAVVRPRLRAVVFAGIAFAAIMWTSNLVALVFAPGLAAYVVALILLEARDRRNRAERRAGFVPSLWTRETLRTALAPGLALALGLGLSAAFFIPALVEQGYINKTQWFGEYYNPEQHFVYFNQLFDPRWGFGISQPGPDDAAQGSLSYQLGAAATLFTVIALALSGRFRPRLRGELRFWGLWLAVAVFLTLPASVLLWRYVPVVGFAQFPWRYLMLAILPLSILPAALCPAVEALAAPRASDAVSHGALPAIILSILLLVSSAPYLKVEIREPTPEQGPVSMSALMRFQRTSDEMTGVTAWVDPARRPIWSDMAELWVQGKPVTTRVDYSQVPQNDTLAINSEEVGTAHEQIYYHARDAGKTVTFNRFWYPGWTAWLLDGKNGKPVRKLDLQRENGPLARIVVPIPQGDGYILLRFEDTPLRRVAEWITFAVILGLLAVFVAVAGLRSRRSRRMQ
ncbi:MAG: hypothetical protein ACM30E_04250 [Nitrososphaerales archaeon]